ncbi:MAG: methionyl-tRNA formyltransferase [Candidatus Omnitrophica bacterium]|nr:methionyl-tRNA formyltransferase [Candidatus Omnitrophota bacterium]
MKFIYFGSDIFSRVVLETLHLRGLTPSLIVTQPNRPKGRGLKITATEISNFAEKNNITCIKPHSLKDDNVVGRIKDENADFIIIADYGKILPSVVFSLSKKISLGVHPSLLPCYRGAAPISYAICNGDKVTGVSIFKIETGTDSGDIISQKEVLITDTDDVASMTLKLAREGALLLDESISAVNDGTAKLIPQKGNISFAAKLEKKDGKINWGRSALEIRNLVRATLGWPSAYTYYKGKTIKIMRTALVDQSPNCQPATIVKISKDGIDIATGDKVLRVQRLQPDGKKEMDAYSFACGQRMQTEEKFDDG